MKTNINSLYEKSEIIHNKKILAVDTSAKSASIAVCEGKNILASGCINNKITHSETLMPLLESLLKAANLSLKDIDCFAVSTGPGSFTGLRISISAVKGMAYALGKKVIPVPTLLALAYNLFGINFTNNSDTYIACPVMDARREQVYNSLFRIEEQKITRLVQDRAVFIKDLEDELIEYEKKEKIILIGDGAGLVNNSIKLKNIMLAPPLLLLQNAVSICLAAADIISDNKYTSAKELMPAYLRLPQAERERLGKI